MKIWLPLDSFAVAMGGEAVAEAILAEAGKRGVKVSLTRNGSRGMAWLEVAGQAPLPLPAGWLALVPRGLGQRLCTRPGAPLLGRADLLPQQMLGDLFSRLCLGHGAGELRHADDCPGAAAPPVAVCATAHLASHARA